MFSAVRKPLATDIIASISSEVGGGSVASERGWVDGVHHIVLVRSCPRRKNATNVGKKFLKISGWTVE